MLDYIFAILGFLYVKSFRKMSVKLTPGGNGKLSPEDNLVPKSLMVHLMTSVL